MVFTAWRFLLVILQLFFQILIVKSEDHELGIKDVRLCEDQGSGKIKWDLHLRRQSRDLVVLEGNISMALDLDPQISGIVEAQEKGNGGWIEGAFVFPFNYFCTEFGKLMEPAWSKMWISAGLQTPIHCPIPKGIYQLKNFPIKEFEKSMMMSQETVNEEKMDYRILFKFTSKSDKAVLGCLLFVISY